MDGNWNWRTLNDDFTSIKEIRPSGNGYAQADPTHKSHKRKNPIGFLPPEKKKPKPRYPRPGK